MLLLLITAVALLHGCAAAVKPNFVLFLQDDQDQALGGWTPMKKAQHLVAEEGVTASNWFIHTPVCCPSRGEILTGRYFHSIRMPTPSGGCMHVDTDKVNPASFGALLGNEGYTMGYFGKHMNHCPSTAPPGWDCPTCRFFANGGGSDGEPGGYLNATFNDYVGGQPAPVDALHSTPGVYTADTNGEFAGYTTSIIANKSIAWLEDVAGKGKPFMLTVASKGPHVPSTPAPWYAHEYNALAAPRTPDYNASQEQLAGHHHLIASQGPITADQGDTIDALFRNRWRTLLSIDDAVEGVVAALDRLNLTNSTYFFITSDHGYNLGQHRLPSCKLNVYDHDVRIPMVIRGPGIRRGTTFALPASNVDVAPTLLGLAGAGPDVLSSMDGKSVAPLIVDADGPGVPASAVQHIRRHLNPANAGGGSSAPAPPAWRDSHLIEYHTLGSVKRTGHLVDEPTSNTFRALRFVDHAEYGDFLYAEFTGQADWNFTAVTFHEAFDVKTDPHQLSNIYPGLSSSTKGALKMELQARWSCKGVSCP